MAHMNHDSAYLAKHPTMAARFPGTCRRCLLPIIVGHTIIKTGGAWVHFRCGAGKPEPKAGTDAFNRRWTELKNEAALRERAQEEAAYRAELEGELRANDAYICGFEECDGEPCRKPGH